MLCIKNKFNEKYLITVCDQPWFTSIWERSLYVIRYTPNWGGGGWKCMMIGFVENYSSWKRIKSPIDQHTVCQFSSIIKATVLRTNIEQSSYHPNALHWSCILIKLLYQCTIFPFQILYIDILNTADHDWVASFVDVLYIAQRHFKLSKTRNAR